MSEKCLRSTGLAGEEGEEREKEEKEERDMQEEGKENLGIRLVIFCIFIIVSKSHQNKTISALVCY